MLLIAALAFGLGSAWGLLMDLLAPSQAIAITLEVIIGGCIGFSVAYSTRRWWLEVKG